ncbi:MAG: matrixin family metalloprotease [Planctomycetota bacterium]
MILFRRWIACAILVTLLPSISSAYILSTRWGATATNGGGLQFGDPTHITWSIVPDGTSNAAEGPSDLIDTFDAIFGGGPGGNDLTQRPWFGFFEDAFDRWSQVSGLSYSYEPNDDGVQSSNDNNPGILGVRGDVRIAGSFQDGQSNVLAFNFFPNNGDMTLDTGDTIIFGNSANDYRALRNILMHEHGHGIGISHVESNNANFLMEPFLATSFFGPQLDDIRAAHRGYGDFFEKSNNGQGNDQASFATPLGLINDGQTAMLGTDGANTVVAASDSDFVSIDGSSDTDFYSFMIDAPGTVDISLTPQGATYSQGPQGGSQSSFNTADDNNLVLALVDSDETTLLTTNNSGGAGQTDLISGWSLAQAGEYFVRVTGLQDSMQFYQLSISVTEDTVVIDVDFNDDGVYNCADIDDLVAEIAGGGNDVLFDLTGDSTVDAADLEAWLAEAGGVNLTSGNPYLVGDANLDGVVDGADFVEWNNNKFTNTAAWCGGDFNADGVVDGVDFVLWNDNKFNAADHAAVPEPRLALLPLMLMVGYCFRRR